MSLFLDDGDVRLYHGDALQVLQGLPAESVHCCVTSPPFYGLRDYGTGRWEGGNPDCDHTLSTQPQERETLPASLEGRDEKFQGGPLYTKRAGRANPSNRECVKCGARRVDQQIGLEETPEQWVDSLVAVFREVKRVLRADGTLWLEVGDGYAQYDGQGNKDDPRDNGMHGAFRVSDALRATADARAERHSLPAGYKRKDLIGAPWMLAMALRADGWYLRSDIVWARPNPMPESVTDRPTKAHSYIFLLAKQPRYFFDQEAIREPHTAGHLQKHLAPLKKNADGRSKALGKQGLHDFLNPAGRNVRSVWTIPTQAYPEAHFATFPEALARRCILAGTSERGCCPECGAPWMREVEQASNLHPGSSHDHTRDLEAGGTQKRADGKAAGSIMRERFQAGREPTTLGWRPSCDCDSVSPAYGLGAASVPCVVLDPFVGSGTVPYVARKHGRHAIGIDLSSSYLQLAARRLQQLSLFAEAPR